MHCFLTLKRFCYSFIGTKSNCFCQTYARIRKLTNRDVGLKYGCRIYSVKISGTWIYILIFANSPTRL